MARKYQVFISSSFVDLQKHRQALIMATLGAGHIPVGMEMLTPGARKSLDVLERTISESDIFAVFVGARLGTRTDERPDSLTFTEREYELALKFRLRVIAFLLDDGDYTQARNAVSADDDERRKEDQLRQFRERVKRVNGGSRIVGYFSYDNIDGLCIQYSRAVADCASLIEEGGGKGGWVAGREFDLLDSRIHLASAVSDNPFFRDLAQHLNRFDKLSTRTNVQRQSKAAIASYFWKRYFPKLHGKQVDGLYFESGSSIAYTSRAFIEQIRQSDWWPEQRMNERIRILTNNILTYLDFLLQPAPWKPMDMRLRPAGPVSVDYGGTYGILSSAVEQAAPSPHDSLRTSLPADAQDLVARVAQDLKAELQRGFVLMTASGVETRPESGDAPYPGPHVGSYANMLLKRSLLMLSCPKVLFLHPDKWGFEFRFNNCHAVCDHSFAWDRVKRESALAIALAAESPSQQQRLAAELKAEGFVNIELEDVQAGSQGPWSVIAANQAFAQYFAVDTA